MQAQAELVETVVKVLEQTVHGTLARFLRAKAEHLAAVSEGLEKKLRYFTRRLHSFPIRTTLPRRST